jgi:Tfp pilus assembly protein PilV
VRVLICVLVAAVALLSIALLIVRKRQHSKRDRLPWWF